jgi:NtrC-family two-component system response regulator AlgB
MRILICDDEQVIRKTLVLCLEAEGHQVIAVSTSADALAAATRSSFDLAFVDLRLGAENGLHLIPMLLAQSPWMKIVMITAYATIDTAVDAMRRGATDYVPKPFTPNQIVAVSEKIGRIRALENRLATLQDGAARDGGPELTSSSPLMQRATELARQVALSDASILLRGESGTGKGVMAQAIHGWSPRGSKPLSVISCPSLSADLLESELFGHVKGSFTGAVRDHPGRIAASDGGTVFLDEIGELPLALQPKLLRFLQDHRFERVGDTATRQADVRIIAATNRDLQAAVAQGSFREDLYYRLNVFPIELPALRDRQPDILTLAHHLLQGLLHGKRILGFTPDAAQALLGYAWPGNIRELRNVVERATILCQAAQIGIEHLPQQLIGLSARGNQVGDLVALEALEEDHIRRVLSQVPALDRAAAILGIDQATLWRRRKKYGI